VAASAQAADVTRAALRSSEREAGPLSDPVTRTPVLRVDGLSRRFGAAEVVKSFDLTLEPGERVALRGPNGSGKTTALRCIAGSLAPTRGEITIGGHRAGSIEARRLLGVSFSQERSFYQRLSGRANLLFFARLRSPSEREARTCVRVLEEELELSTIAPKRVDSCSTGMLQQLAFARALLGDPALLLLDEPTRSLDKEAVERLWAALDRRRTTAVLIATHRPEDIARCGSATDFSLA
jgi:ABC-type multidrug transport system ATPase subunit